MFLYYLLKEREVQSSYRFFGLMLFFAAFGLRRMIWYFWIPDSALIFIVCMFLYLHQKTETHYNIIALATVLTIDVLIKESILFFLPLYFIKIYKKRNIRDRSRNLLYFFLGLLLLMLFISLFFLIPAKNFDQNYISSLPYELWQVQGGTSDYNYIDSFLLIGVEFLQNLTFQS